MLFKSSKFLAFTVGALGLISASAHAEQVALLDSGVDPDRGFNIAQGFNYFLDIDDTTDVSDREGEGHGTVSTRVAAEAFSGEIVPFVVSNGSFSIMPESEARARVARNNALSDILGRDSVRVVGITWGTDGITGASAPLLTQLSDANKVISITAGNDSSSQPNALSTSSFNLAGVIIVGGADTDGVLLPLTNRAGTTANKYVAAIGLPEPDAELGGSSWAAARIAGIAGAVLQQNPDLTAEEVADVIFQSAEDLGEAGTDSEYGRGFIRNADQVLNNVIGPVTVPTPDAGGGGGGGGGAGLLLGAAVAGGLLLLRKPKTKLEKTLVLDSYGRTFQLDLGNSVIVNDGALHLSDFFNGLDQKSVNDQIVLPKLSTQIAFGATSTSDHRLDLIEYFAQPGDVVIENENANLSFAVASQLSRDLSLTAGYQVSPDQTFGAVSGLDSHQLFGVSSFISGQSFGSVLNGFGGQAETVSFAYAPGTNKKLSTRLGLVSVDQSQRFGQDSFSSILEGKYQFNDNAGLSMQFGQIEEKGSLLGGAAGGIFGVETATTYAINVAGNIKATERLSIVANYGVGRTNVDSSQNSLLADFSSLNSDWYSVGLIGNNIFREQDQFGVAFSQPLKIHSGAVDFSIPTGRDINGDIAFDTERVNLSETGATERNIEGYYRTMLSKKLELGSFFSYRQNPNHVSENGDEVLVMATLRYYQ